VAFMAAFIEKMGGVGNNPLGVQAASDAKTPDQGIQAAVNLLHAPQFQALNAVLLGGSAATTQNDRAVQQELSQWSGGAISGALDAKAHIQEATDAVVKYQTGQAPAPAG